MKDVAQQFTEDEKLCHGDGYYPHTMVLYAIEYLVLLIKTLC
jgi:hypothetical protein